ncbi:hypothetical protein ACFS5L_43780 [Streptomyces phyllanthi]|uniref:Uncharacterized protein n=1 Tax=Streptomyces phyllanthi TaxID=1803180 RepID=A0A5N8VXE4_9ACTN|nr:hypothetical protein [Streptomyces phyllanthi]MPY39927.1 hypothetical protein [Streptomyces phyllanthi]
MTPFLRIPGRGSRRSDHLNRLVVIAAVFGIGLGGWGLWLETEEYLDRAASREKITKACEGLVDPDRVLGLNGGTARARPGSEPDDSMFDLDDPDALAMMPTGCLIYRVGDPGTSYEHFKLSVWPTPSDRFAQIVDGWDDPFSERMSARTGGLTREADTSAPYPLGDGRLGVYYDDFVIVKALCSDKPGDKTSLNVMTVARYSETEPVTDADRHTLAELARTAAERAAAKVGCAATLPALPAELPTPTERLVNAESAKGSCGWYADFVAERDRVRLPDRALTAPVGARALEESCLLAVSDKEVSRIWSGLTEDEIGSSSLRDVLRTAPWWLRTESYFGDEAHEVKAQDFGSEQRPIDHGTAGADKDAKVWWASSLCDGQPAVHTLSVEYPYEKYIRQLLQPLFRAYVTDVAARRGCRDVKLPAASTFTS